MNVVHLDAKKLIAAWRGDTDDGRIIVILEDGAPEIDAYLVTIDSRLHPASMGRKSLYKFVFGLDDALAWCRDVITASAAVEMKEITMGEGPDAMETFKQSLIQVLGGVHCDAYGNVKEQQ